MPAVEDTAARGVVEPFRADVRQLVDIVDRHLVAPIESRRSPLAIEIQIVADSVGVRVHVVPRPGEGICDIGGEPLAKAPREARLKSVVLTFRSELDDVHGGVSAVRPDGIGRVVRRRIGNRVAERQLIDVPDIGVVGAAVADVRRVEGELPGQLTLHPGVPGVGAGRMAGAARPHGRHRESDAGVHERRCDLIDVAAKEARRVAERRVAEAVEVQIVLAKAFVEDAIAGADGGPPITGDIPGHAAARRQIDGGVDGPFRQTRCALFDHPVDEIAASRNDASAEHARSGEDADSLRRIVGIGDEVILQKLAGGVRRAKVGDAEAVVERHARRRSPGVLCIALEPRVAEVAVLGGHLEPGTSVFTFATITLGILSDAIDLTKVDDYNWR